jgi:hypothetical protein
MRALIEKKIRENYGTKSAYARALSIHQQNVNKNIDTIVNGVNRSAARLNRIGLKLIIEEK